MNNAVLFYTPKDEINTHGLMLTQINDSINEEKCVSLP